MNRHINNIQNAIAAASTGNPVNTDEVASLCAVLELARTIVDEHEKHETFRAESRRNPKDGSDLEAAAKAADQAYVTAKNTRAAFLGIELK